MLSNLAETKIHFDLDCGYLEDVHAQFDVHVESYPAEPHSWGQSRGTETAVSAELITAQLGGLKLNRNQLVEMLSNAEVENIEATYEETYHEQLEEV